MCGKVCEFLKRLAGALALAGVLVLAPARADDPPRRFELTISDGKVAETGIVRVLAGERVVLIWRADRETELHLHGYDIEATAAPDRPTTMAFEARAEGRFPVTAHRYGGGATGGHGAEALLYLEVHPR